MLRSFKQFNKILKPRVSPWLNKFKHNEPNSSNKNIEISKNDEQFSKFNDAYHEIVKNLTNNANNANNAELKEALDWFRRVLDYNLPHGKKNRGMAFVNTYCILNQMQNNEKELERVRALGWSLELFQAFFLILDDIMDNSITRRQKLCWYRNKDVGMIAINDAVLIESSSLELIKMYYGNEKYYIDLVNLMLQTTRQTIFGQSLDLLSYPLGTERPNLKQYTSERHALIVKYKTSYYSFCLPVRLALYCSALNDPHVHSRAEHILLKVGQYFQTQDDYLDCFGDPRVIGKIGTDIQDGKCSWPVVVALQLADQRQRTVLDTYYGIDDDNAIKKVKHVYNELELQNHYRKYEEKIYEELVNDINLESNCLPPQIFHSFLNKIYKRNN